MARKPIHPALKERLGYDRGVSDEEFLADWKRRSTRVCKPCWELRYCPYGPLVEQSPHLPPLRQEVIESNEYYRECLRTGMLGEHGELDGLHREHYEQLLRLHEHDPEAFARYLAVQRRDYETALDASDEPLPPIEDYSVPFPFEEPQQEKAPELPEIPQAEVAQEVRRIEEALQTGHFDDRVPLDSARHRLFEEELEAFDPVEFPESIPKMVAESACNFFGHICPVVFTAENVSETDEERRRGRSIPAPTKMRVARRDNMTCQDCGKLLRDDEVEFDHLIPLSRGGSSEEHNLRLTCRECNRRKSKTFPRLNP